VSARVWVDDDWMSRGVTVVVSPQEGRLLLWGQTAITEAGMVATPDEAKLNMDEPVARALYEALARYFGGAPDMATVRRDYDAERARVDKFIEHLLRVAS
jgi:hypothetical protein